MDPWAWTGFAAFIAALLLVDLVAFGRRGEAVSLRRAAGWSAGWTVLGLAFGGFLWLWQDERTAGEYLAGFVIEKSLSIDNLFVFALIFASFGVPAAHQRRAVFWGIVGAIVLRAIFVFAGAALLDAVHYTVYAFGAFLVLTGIRMARHHQDEVHPERNPLLRLLGRIVPFTAGMLGRFRYLSVGLAAVLVFVGTKMVLADVQELPIYLSLAVIVAILAAAVLVSLLRPAALARPDGVRSPLPPAADGCTLAA